MPRIILKKSFTKDLDGLKRNARKQYQRVNEILIELQRDQTPTAPRRAETRIPNCIKFELQDGYRIVFQRLEEDDALIALTVGIHDHVDSFLDGHKGYVFDQKTGTLRELRLASADETTVEVVPSPELREKTTELVAPEKMFEGVFKEFTETMYLRIGVPVSFVGKLISVRDANSLECTQILQELEPSAPRAADLLLTFATGNIETRQSVSAIARGEAQDRPSLEKSDLPAIETSSEEFLTFNDPKDLDSLFEHGTFEEWQLFLHPDQRVLAQKDLAGPARIRGISGSGKSVVALHRARHLAIHRKFPKQKILFTTFDKGLALAAGHLLDKLCGPERGAIEVTHLHRWCLDYLEFRGLSRPRYNPEESRSMRRVAWGLIPDALNKSLKDLPQEYVWSEVEFIFGRFLHEESDRYADTDRSGRGRPLSAQQRQAILSLYKHFHRKLFERGFVEPAEFVRMAYRQHLAGEETEHDYAAVIVDEVQDISEIALKLLHSVVGDKQNGLLLVGDTTQRIFTRGYSLRGIGIDIGGRGVVLRKNYRNTREILQAAFPLVVGEWDADLAGSDIDPQSVRPEYSVREGHRPIIVQCKNEGAEGRFIASEISTLLKYRYHNPREICVLARNQHYRDLALDALKGANIPVYTFKSMPGGEVSPELEAVRVSSLHGAKGHEFGAVFIMGCVDGVIPQRSAAEELSGEKAVLYVGMTRARDIVYLSYSERDSQGRRTSRSQLISEIENYCDSFEYQGNQ